MKKFLKKMARVILGPYELYTIYESPLNSKKHDNVIEIKASDLKASEYIEIADLSIYDSSETYFFAYIENTKILGVCVYWFGQQYKLKRNFWPLKHNEAKLIQITLAECARGKGFAPRLISGSSFIMAQKGFVKLYSRVWRNHTASDKSFLRAGWIKKASLITVQFLGKSIKIKLG